MFAQAAISCISPLDQEASGHVAETTQKRKRIMLAVLAALLAAAAFTMAFLQLNAGKASTASPGQASVATAKAVVAATDINVGDQLTAANLTISDYPATALPAAGLFYADLKPLVSSAWYSNVKLPRGQLVLTTQLSHTVAPEKMPPITLADGNVAMSIPYDETKDGGGFIQQDDYMDILVDDPTSKTVHYAFQGVHVLRLGDRTAQPAAGVTQAPGASASAAPAAAAPAAVPVILLIELPREQAAALAFAIDQSYVIRYVIRPHDQQTGQPLPGSSPVGPSNWLNVISG